MRLPFGAKKLGRGAVVLCLVACCALVPQLFFFNFFQHDSATAVLPVCQDREQFSLPSRIPAYIQCSNTPHFGYVMRDFAHRILSRHIVRMADVLVVDELPLVSDPSFDASVGPSFVRHAEKEGHRVHVTPELTESWVRSLPKWILLAVFDVRQGSEYVSFTSELATSLFVERTVTYIVFRVSASGRHIHGAEAATALMSLGYKVQLLSASHPLKTFQPNVLLTQTTVVTFLEAGADVTGAAELFNAYLFATQGLDLAIPSQREYGVHKTCPISPLRAEFVSDAVDEGSLRVVCGNKSIEGGYKISSWAGSGPKSEAACVTARCEARDASACSTRVVVDTSIRSSNADMPNLLVIMIDPISRPLFHRSLPKTRLLMDRMGFTSFEKYSAVGENSGPNQAALYAGRVLLSRGDIASMDKGSSWIWDELRDAGYATFKAEDGCVRNSNMIQSVRPNTTHGDVLQHMLCYDFSRPNCVGDVAAAKHLTMHVTQFIDAYVRRGSKWAAFASFIDSHEDTNVLAATLDDPIFDFVSDLHATHPKVFEDTMIVLLSDHGLHYGSSLQTEEGRRDRASPVLFLKPPGQSPPSFLENAGLWTSPFDVHATFQHLFFGRRTQVGSSLLRPLPKDRTGCRGSSGVPDRFCLLWDDAHPREPSLEMASPASILSYLADIPKERRSGGSHCAEAACPGCMEPLPSSCLCASNSKHWRRCHGDSSTPPVSPAAHSPEDFFVLVDCPDQALRMHTAISPNGTLRSLRRGTRRQVSM